MPGYLTGPAAAGGASAAVGAFFAYPSVASATFAVGSPVLFACDTEQYDQADWFNTTTYRYTPQVAGIYMLHVMTAIGLPTDAQNIRISIRKNGVAVRTAGLGITGALVAQTPRVDAPVQANGTTDYFDVTVESASHASGVYNAGPSVSSFSGYRIA